ncbi:molybdopterin synthase subunit MoaE [Palleronia aestuarii]|uniref:Molybdopterin synthase catalytic subunit n=1 Tax=Palleronia aestuarii TaxID=568105 RepID=A0A2W7N6U6_9RHOB|nr:molybdenum cofactor biosynthesis protein MoaE [Palleronia aestuarii]PZX15831.1 molybdopterin synthase subunit MoaE [Palleronia aestuarii]
MDIRVQPATFDPGAEANAFTAASRGSGAVVTFTGIVRDTEAGTLRHLEIEHYPGMTASSIKAIAGEAVARWSLDAVLVIHRHGALAPGEAIMMVATAARHRAGAFAAADFLMDYLKSRAPFWKKEVRTDGADWVDAKAEDEAALSRW